MLSDSGSHEQLQQQPQKGLQIKQDDKFFSRLMSKETSMANSSCRVYYGGASGAIPFMWESQPGTPKHPSCETTLPPLTPPPSYSFKSKSKQKKSMKSTLLSSIFPRLITPRKNQASSPSSSRSSTSSSSSTTLSSWTSLLHDYSGSSPSANSSAMNRKSFHRQRSYLSCSRSPVHNCCMDVDDDEEGLQSPTSTLRFGVKPRNLIEFRGCQSMANIKKALLSIVSHGSGQGTSN